MSDVRVSLKDGLTILDLRAENRVTLAQLRRIIKDNGFVPKEAKVIAIGAPSSNSNMFTVSGTNEQLPLAGPARRDGDEWRMEVPPPDRH